MHSASQIRILPPLKIPTPSSSISSGKVSIDERALTQILASLPSQNMPGEYDLQQGLRELATRQGLDYKDFPKITLTKHYATTIEKINFKDIDITCRSKNYFGILDGTAQIAYVPESCLIDLSDLKQLIAYFCNRPQNSQALAQQISDSLKLLLNSQQVAVRIDASHFSVSSNSNDQSLGESTILDSKGVFSNKDHGFSKFLG